MACKDTKILHNSIKVNITPFLFSQFNSLKNKWKTLEKTSPDSFFLSWKWISVWLSQVVTNERMILVEAVHQDKVVGLGVFVEKKTTRYGFIDVTQWFLHRSGNSIDDQIWIENNGFLTANQNKEEITKAIWCELLSSFKSVDEFVVAIYHNKYSQFKLPNKSMYQTISLNTENGYYLILDNLISIDKYFLTLSKNTRQQIKRSSKLLNKMGKFEFSVISSAQRQKDLLDQGKQWHIEKWQDTATPSGFINIKFRNFHNNLIKEKHDSTKTVIASLKIDNELYGLLYCFIDSTCAYFYLSALKPITDNRIKLGLTLHSLFIQWLIESNIEIDKYDFLAGEARYKKSLASHQDTHCYLVVQKKCVKFKIEKILQRLKGFIPIYLLRKLPLR